MPRIPHMTGSSIIGVALVIVAIVAEVMHLAFPTRPIGEQLIGGFLAGGLAAMRIPQKAAPVVEPPAT